MTRAGEGGGGAHVEQHQGRMKLDAHQQTTEQRELRLRILAALGVKPRQSCHLADPHCGGLAAPTPRAGADAQQ